MVDPYPCLVSIPPRFATTAPSNPPAGPVSRLIRMAYEMDLERTPIPMIHPDTGEVFGYVHYGTSPLVRQIRMMPVFQIAIEPVQLGFGQQAPTTAERHEYVGFGDGDACDAELQIHITDLGSSLALGGNR